MTTSTEVLAAIDAAFHNAPKPEHFMDYAHCEEYAEHDELLRTRDGASLRIEDVGNIGWQPISACFPEGMAYYMPALARLALAEPTYNYGWYGDTLHIHLSHDGKENSFLQYCNLNQRKAVADLCDISIQPSVNTKCASQMLRKWNNVQPIGRAN